MEGKTDIKNMMDIAEKNEPIGNNEWYLVSSIFFEYAPKQYWPMQDVEYFMEMLDCLANNKKPNMDPNISHSVRRENPIGEILFRRSIT